MEPTDTVVGVFANHQDAENAVKSLTNAGFTMSSLSVIGKGYHTEEKVVGFYNAGDRIKLWGTQGALWGGLWGLFFGGLLMTVPLVGHVVVLGYLATIAMAALENSVLIGGLSALGAAIYSLGIPPDTVLQYEDAIKADSYLVMVNSSSAEVARAKAALGTAKPIRIDVHAYHSPADGLVTTVPLVNTQEAITSL